MTCSLCYQIDLHVHTQYSVCARPEMQLQQIVDTAARRGIRFLGVTDHVDAYVGEEVLGKIRGELGRLDAQVPGMSIFVGCEADILDIGKHVVTEDMKKSLDYVMVSANHFHDPAVAQPKGDLPRDVGRHFLEMFRYACSLDFVDVVAHPLVVFPGTFAPECLFTLGNDDILEALCLARDNGIAMEISPRGLEPDQLDFRVRFLSLCKEAGLKFSIGSDAHSLARVGQVWQLALLLDKVGITDEDIWLPSMRKSLSSRAV
ncbi:MAG: PHP domain-containing protein [Armatimonadota bacterium]